MATSSNPATALSTQESTALITQESMSSVCNKTWVSGADWDRHRTRITHLYQTRPLREVMRVMESECDFRATPRMYKTRIHQWGLDKNKKENEMRAAVRKRDQRERQGKSSVFRVRGRVVDFGDIVRYWERKGMTIEDVVAQRAMSATPDAVVECSTPVASPPSTPAEFRVFENVIRSVRDYCQGSFESGTWISEDPRTGCKSMKDHGDGNHILNSLTSCCILACRLFEQSRFDEAGRMLICATASIKKVLQAEHPRTLLDLFGTVIEMALQNRYEIAIAVLQQTADLGELIVGGGHPLSSVCKWLASLESSQSQNILVVCVQAVGDQFEQLLGPMHSSTLTSRLGYADVIDPAQNTGQGETVIKKLLASCIQSLGSSDARTLDAYISLAYEDLATSDYIAAQKLARQIIQYSQNVEPREDNPYFHARGLHLLSRAQYGLGEMASAESNLRQAIDIRMSVRGTTDILAAIWLSELEKWVANGGNLASAAQLHAWSSQILSSMEVEE